MTVIIAGYPGVGKTHFVNNHLGIKMIDLDSSGFPKDNFPKNYLDAIESNVGTASIIFISSHQEIQDALIKKNISFNIIYPNPQLKEEYLLRYKKRNNLDTFCKYIDSIWYDSITHIENIKHTNVKTIQLQSKQTVSDVISKVLLFGKEYSLK